MSDNPDRTSYKDQHLRKLENQYLVQHAQKNRKSQIPWASICGYTSLIQNKSFI